MENKFLTPKQLSERWSGKPSVHTLASWRQKGKGPRFVKLAGIKYPMNEVIKYEKKLKLI